MTIWTKMRFGFWFWSNIFAVLNVYLQLAIKPQKLAQWITYVEMRWVYEDSATQFTRFDQDSSELVTREEVKKVKYFVEGNGSRLKTEKLSR